MLVLVAVVLLLFGVMMRRTTQSKEWMVVANTAIFAGVLFLLYVLFVVVFVI